MSSTDAFSAICPSFLMQQHAAILEARALIIRSHLRTVACHGSSQITEMRPVEKCIKKCSAAVARVLADRIVHQIVSGQNALGIISPHEYSVVTNSYIFLK